MRISFVECKNVLAKFCRRISFLKCFLFLLEHLFHQFLILTLKIAAFDGALNFHISCINFLCSDRINVIAIRDQGFEGDTNLNPDDMEASNLGILLVMG